MWLRQSPGIAPASARKHPSTQAPKHPSTQAPKHPSTHHETSSTRQLSSRYLAAPSRTTRRKTSWAFSSRHHHCGVSDLAGGCRSARPQSRTRAQRWTTSGRIWAACPQLRTRWGAAFCISDLAVRLDPWPHRGVWSFRPHSCGERGHRKHSNRRHAGNHCLAMHSVSATWGYLQSESRSPSRLPFGHFRSRMSSPPKPARQRGLAGSNAIHVRYLCHLYCAQSHTQNRRVPHYRHVGSTTTSLRTLPGIDSTARALSGDRLLPWLKSRFPRASRQIT
jgi:hypothetical protein